MVKVALGFLQKNPTSTVDYSTHMVPHKPAGLPKERIPRVLWQPCLGGKGFKAIHADLRPCDEGIGSENKFSEKF